MNIKSAITCSEVLKKANPSTMARLVNSAILTRMHKGEFLFFEREEMDFIYFLVRGKLSVYKSSTNGEKKIMFILDDGAVVNEDVLYTKVSSTNCELLEDSYLISICVDTFISIMEDDFQLTKAIIDSLSLKNRRLYRQLKNTSSTIKGDKKIAAKLWKIALDQDKGRAGDADCSGGDEIHMTITCLAEMIGSRRETVSRQVKSLSQKGLLYHKNGKFIIPDRDALKNYYNQP